MRINEKLTFICDRPRQERSHLCALGGICAPRRRQIEVEITAVWHGSLMIPGGQIERDIFGIEREVFSRKWVKTRQDLAFDPARA